MHQLSLQGRVFRSSKLISASSVTARPLEYKAWDKESMEIACKEVHAGRLSIRRAAEAFSVPRSTLGDHVSGRVIEGAHSGPSRYLTDEEEAELVHFLIGSAKVGYARTKKDILAIVDRIVEAKGLKRCPVSHGWWDSFRKRHPHLTLRTVEKLSYARYVSTDPVIINQYFDLLKSTLIDNDLMDKPTHIFNCDETGMPLNHLPKYVVSEKGDKHPRAVTSGSKKQITVLACASAAGYVLPPLVIFSRKSLNQELTIGEVPGTMYGLTESGWMDGEVFDNWFTHHFLVHAPPLRPLLLLLDGHSTHYNPSFIRKAAQEKVIVFCLPPNTTHITQPLDKGVFGPLKMSWANECHRYMQQHPGKVVTQYEFTVLFGKAWCNAMTPSNIMAAFRTTGVFPFNSLVVAVPSKQVFNPKSLTKSTGLAYIPLYSPHKPERPRQSHAHSSQHTCETFEAACDASNSFESDIVFSEQEEALYRTRFEEGYDLCDSRYDQWRRKNNLHYDESSYVLVSNDEESFVSGAPPNLLLNKHRSAIKKFLPPSPPIVKKPQTYQKTSAKVLTSNEHMWSMEEKERLKRQKQEEKERRMNDRKMRKERARQEKMKGM